MASVIREQRNGRTLYRIQFVDGDKRRKSIRLSGLTLKAVETVRAKIEVLVACRIAGSPLDSDTSRWLANLGDDLTGKLADAGLCDRRCTATLGAFLDGYIASRTDAQPSTVTNWKGSRDKLTDFLGEDRDLRTISPGDADDWRQGLVNKGLAEATISKLVKHARHFLKAACRKRLADTNPFAELKAGGERNDERKAFVGRETIAKVLEACPDAEWRAIVALARYGGLRVPSELLALRLTDIDWAGERFTVTSRKTKRYGKPWRVVPLFLELYPFLLAAAEAAPEGAEFVINRYRDGNANLRTQLQRILRKAGVEPWERLFHNLRASRQTELENQFPSHVVCSWLGNSESIASKHYLQVTPEHFALAVASSSPFADAQGGATGGARVVRQVVLQPTEGDGNET